MAEPPRNGSYLITSYSNSDTVSDSEESLVSDEMSSTIIPTGMREQHRRRFLLRWTKLYPWVATEGSGEFIAGNAGSLV